MQDEPKKTAKTATASEEKEPSARTESRVSQNYLAG